MTIFDSLSSPRFFNRFTPGTSGSFVKRLAVLVTAFASSLLLASIAQASCDWTVKGKILVDHSPGVSDELGDRSPLENVSVRVQARVRIGVWGTWNSWDTVRSDHNGSFEVRNTKNCVKRQFRVKVRFQDSDLEVRDYDATTSVTSQTRWFEVDSIRGNGTGPSNVNFGDIVVRPNENFETVRLGLGFDRMIPSDEFELSRHADTWVLYKKVIDLMDEFGSRYEFGSQVKIKPMHDGVLAGDGVEAPYANPTTKVIYITANPDEPVDWFTTDTLLHELGHIWAYRHSRGEGCLVTAIFDGNTHGFSNRCVAFHEGFAQFFSNQVSHELFGNDSVLPFNRVFMTDEGMSDIRDVYSHDDGWISLFSMMVASDLGRLDLLEADDGWPRGDSTEIHAIPMVGLDPYLGCGAPGLGLKNVLRVFDEDEGAGYSRQLDTSVADQDHFLDRAERILTKMGDGDSAAIERLLDPGNDEQPVDYFCSSMFEPSGVMKGF